MKLAPLAMVLSLTLPLFACAAESADEGSATSNDDELNAVPGAFQVRLRSTTGEDVVLAFDKETRPVAGRPECEVVVASPLRVAVSKGAGLSPARAEVIVDNYVRGRTVAFTRSAEDSKTAVLTRASRVSFRAEIPGFVIGKRCSGEPLEYHQNLKIVLDGKPLVDPIGDKDNFWATLASAPKSGISPSARSTANLASVEGAQVALTFGKLAGDDPAQPATCTQVQAIPARLTVKAPGARTVEVKLENYLSGRTIARTLAPSSPGVLRLTATSSDGTFGADVPPMVIESACSGTPWTYDQVLTLTIDGKTHTDPVGRKPSFNLDLAKSP
jgi:hypothetical protein